jgi:hypothetical protein
MTPEETKRAIDAIQHLRRGDAVEVLVLDQDAGKYEARFWFVSVLQCVEHDRAIVLTVSKPAANCGFV